VAESIGRIHRRRSFAALGRSRHRGTAGPLRARWVPGAEATGSEALVAYAIGRHCGSAVVRNRLRRRLREAIRTQAAELRPGCYLVTADPAATQLSFEELQRMVTTALTRASGGVPV
jgi:ribonuclease P protein component